MCLCKLNFWRYWNSSHHLSTALFGYPVILVTDSARGYNNTNRSLMTGLDELTFCKVLPPKLFCGTGACLQHSGSCGCRSLGFIQVVGSFWLYSVIGRQWGIISLSHVKKKSIFALVCKATYTRCMAICLWVVISSNDKCIFCLFFLFFFFFPIINESKINGLWM